jgi:hypothetical protein
MTEEGRSVVEAIVGSGMGVSEWCEANGVAVVRAYRLLGWFRETQAEGATLLCAAAPPSRAIFRLPLPAAPEHRCAGRMSCGIRGCENERDARSSHSRGSSAGAFE